MTNWLSTRQLFETEAKRRVRKEPPVLDAELKKRIVISRPNQSHDSMEDTLDPQTQTDVVSALWVFE